MVLAGDAVKSIMFIGFQEEPPKPILLGKDVNALSVTASEFMVDETSLSFVVMDAEKNAHIMNYSPNSK